MKGFTFIELIITVGIIIFLFMSLVAGYNRFTDVALLKQAALTLKNNLRLAQSKAISGSKPLGLPCDQLIGYKLAFTQTTYTIQALCNPSQPLASTTTITLTGNVSFSPVPSPVTFRVLTQGVDIAVDSTFTLIRGSKKYRLTLTPQGEISDVGLQ